MTVEIQYFYGCIGDACICYCWVSQDGLPIAAPGTGASLRAPRGEHQQRRRRHYFARVDSEEEEEEEEEEQLSDGDMQLSHPGDS